MSTSSTLVIAIYLFSQSVIRGGGFTVRGRNHMVSDVSAFLETEPLVSDNSLKGEFPFFDTWTLVIGINTLIYSPRQFWCSLESSGRYLDPSDIFVSI